MKRSRPPRRKKPLPANRTYLKRTRINQTRRRAKPRPPGHVDEAYKTWVRLQPCIVCRTTPPSEAHHAGGHGLSQLPPDSTCIPLCRQCHRDRHNLTGPFFYDLSKASRREWEDGMIRLYWTRYAQSDSEKGKTTNGKNH